MADIELTRSHSRGLEGGRDVVENVAKQLQTDLGITYQWDGDTLLVEGQGAEGRIEVGSERIQLLINLSAFLKPVQERVKTEAENYLDDVLSE